MYFLAFSFAGKWEKSVVKCGVELKQFRERY
jgi:hypothetical protein